MFQEVVVSLKLHLLTYSWLGWLNDASVDLGLALPYRFEGWKINSLPSNHNYNLKVFFQSTQGEPTQGTLQAHFKFDILQITINPTYNMSDEQNSGAGKSST